jgi:hypothetical protein
VLVGPLARPESAAANPLDKVCSLVGTIGEGWLGKACHAAAHPKQALGAAKALLSGKPGQALKTLLNGAKNNVLSPSGVVGIAAIVAWAVGGAHFVLSETAKLVGQSTSPELTASWFSSTYWRVAGVAALLTLPFLFAAAIQAVMRSDGALIARATLGYLPLSFLATGVAAPIAMMLLAVTDWMGASVAKAAGDQGSHFLVLSGTAIGALGVAAGSPFVTFLIALLTAAGGLILWLELLIREAAVYVVVLMLPLAFAAMVWPARRIWAVRAVELLVALILSKFAIVAVLSLAAAALGHGVFSGNSAMLSGLVLVTLAAFAPWAMLRMLPLADIASAAAGSLKREAMPSQRFGEFVMGGADRAAMAVEPARSESGTTGDAWSPEASAKEGAQAHTESLAQLEPVPVMVGGGGEDDEDDSGEAFGDDGAPLPPSSFTGGTDPGANGRGPAASEPEPADDAPDRTDPVDTDPAAVSLSALVDEDRHHGYKTWPPLIFDPGDGGRPPTDDGLPADEHDPLPPDQEPEDGPL